MIRYGRGGAPVEEEGCVRGQSSVVETGSAGGRVVDRCVVGWHWWGGEGVVGGGLREGLAKPLRHRYKSTLSQEEGVKGINTARYFLIAKRESDSAVCFW